MADLGSIAKTGILSKGSAPQGPPWGLRSVVCGDRYMVIGGKDTSDGFTGQPSLRMDARGTWRFRWVVAAGSRTLSVYVKQAVNLSPRPQVTVKANSTLGVAADVTTVAGSSTGWIQVSVTVAPSSPGVLEVVLENRYDGQAYATPCYWDQISWT